MHWHSNAAYNINMEELQRRIPDIVCYASTYKSYEKNYDTILVGCNFQSMLQNMLVNKS